MHSRTSRQGAWTRGYYTLLKCFRQLYRLVNDHSIGLKSVDDAAFDWFMKLGAECETLRSSRAGIPVDGHVHARERKETG